MFFILENIKGSIEKSTAFRIKLLLKIVKYRYISNIVNI